MRNILFWNVCPVRHKSVIHAVMSLSLLYFLIYSSGEQLSTLDVLWHPHHLSCFYLVVFHILHDDSHNVSLVLSFPFNTYIVKRRMAGNMFLFLFFLYFEEFLAYFTLFRNFKDNEVVFFFPRIWRSRYCTEIYCGF